MHDSPDESAQTSFAMDRPLGQADPVAMDRPDNSHRLTLMAFGALAAGLACWAWTIWLVGDPWRPLPVAGYVLLCFGVLNARFPLQFASKQELNCDFALMLLCATLLTPTWGIPVYATGYGIGYTIRFRGKLDIDLPFNVGASAIAMATSIAFLEIAGWSWIEPNSVLTTVGLALAVSAIQIGILQGLIAFVVHLQSGMRWRQVFIDATWGAQTAEKTVAGAMVALGTIGVILGQEANWTLLLLVAPAFALWETLRLHIETRHRIEASLETAQHVARIGTLDWDLRNRDMRWSTMLFNILGYTAQSEASLDRYLARVTSTDRATVATAFASAATGSDLEIEHRIELPDGQLRAFGVSFNPVLDRHHRAKRVVATVHDVTDRKMLEDRLQFQAFHDPLTLLPNRAMFNGRLETAFSRYARDGSIALLFLDLDRFKLINDTLGHDAGDQLLRTVARRLEQCIRPNDMVARLGGDEFVVLLDGVHNDDEAIRVAQRILSEIQQPVPLDNQREIHVATSIGIVRPTSDHLTHHDFLRDADVALYHAKESGRGRFAVFSTNMGEGNRQRLDLEDDIRTAFAEDQFSVVYQPRFDLRTGAIAMLEVLIRWNHPDRGTVPPLQFIPVLEEIGLSEQLLDATLSLVFADIAVWRKLPETPPPVSLNLTSRQVLDDALPVRLRERFAQSGVSPAALRFEVPERAITANEAQIIRVLTDLRALGIRTAIDDFGTGHASLPALSRIPVDMLQLDQSLVGDLASSERAETIAQAVIGLAHGLGLTVVGEGVETAAQLAILQRLNCDLVQGHLFRKAGPIADLLTSPPDAAILLAALGNDVILGESGPTGLSGLDS